MNKKNSVVELSNQEIALVSGGDLFDGLCDSLVNIAKDAAIRTGRAISQGINEAIIKVGREMADNFMKSLQDALKNNKNP
ncbi:MAG: hypothetical protein ACD_21C00196G0008 [uncultured bacterium]|nr:MAG: hypothetical protein ACD_21C00196G0008 [uncultured bacterium]